MFICAYCSYVVLIRERIPEIVCAYQQQHFYFVAISTKDADKNPADSPEQLCDQALTQSFTFTLLYDSTQEVVKSYYGVLT